MIYDFHNKRRAYDNSERQPFSTPAVAFIAAVLLLATLWLASYGR